jgi:two-component system chemotaxis response regulator CheY
MKILVVDDSPTARQLTKKFLKDLEYANIIEAENGKQGLEQLEAHPDIELVLLDRYMPEMDGIEFIRKTKSNPKWKGIKVSMVTSEDDLDERFKTVAEHRADYYIIKPVTAQSLVRMFAKLFPDG